MGNHTEMDIISRLCISHYFCFKANVDMVDPSKNRGSTTQ